MEVKKTHKTPAEILKAFKLWSTGHTGLTTKQLVEIFSNLYNLTPAETKTLEDELNKEEKKKNADEEKKKADEAAKKKVTVKPELTIQLTPYPKWWKDAGTWNINLVDAGTSFIVSPTPNHNIFISTIVFTVDGETTVALGFGVFGFSGAMNFGGEGQPMGIVIAMGNSPAPCGTGGFKILSTGAGVKVQGFITYYSESVIIPKL